MSAKIDENYGRLHPKAILGEYGIPNATDISNLPLRDIIGGVYSAGWSIEIFKKTFHVEIVHQSEDEMELEFDLIGCSAAIANALRRILLSEVPSMAIEKVFMLNNTSLIQDEVLAHRLGLLPLKADPRLFEYPTNTSNNDNEISDQDTLRYEIKVTCAWNPNPPKDSKKPDDVYKNSSVRSKGIKWVPIGRQAELYPNGENEFGMVENDILLCKMRPGQEIHAYMHAVKGIGKDHAKFSPVATATYRLLPDIQIRKPIIGDDAELFQSCFSPGVIEIIENDDGEKEAIVKDARYDSCSRNVFRHEKLKHNVQLGRIPDHFIFTVESVGALPARMLFIEAVKVLKGKCKTFLEELSSVK